MLAMTLTLSLGYYWWAPQPELLYCVFAGGGITELPSPELPSPGTSGRLFCEGCPYPQPITSGSPLKQASCDSVRPPYLTVD